MHTYPTYQLLELRLCNHFGKGVLSVSFRQRGQLSCLKPVSCISETQSSICLTPVFNAFMKHTEPLKKVLGNEPWVGSGGNAFGKRQQNMDQDLDGMTP